MIDGAFQEQLKAKRSLSSLCSARRPAASQVELRHPQNTPLEPQTAKKQRGAFRTNSVYKIAGKLKKKAEKIVSAIRCRGATSHITGANRVCQRFQLLTLLPVSLLSLFFFLFFVGDILKQVKLDVI